MTNEFKRVWQGIFCFLLLNIQWTANCIEVDGGIVNRQNNGLRAKLGETCWDKICEENQFCNEGHSNTCQCLPGFKIANNECIPSGGENESCTKHEDCCGHLLCINGICRKPSPNTEFVTLAKICLGITVTTIVIAVFSSLIKCLLRYDNSRAFQRRSNTSSFNSILPFRRPMANPGRDLYDVRDEKPPSYEECVRATGGSNLPVEPPPYTISTNSVTATIDTRPTFQTINLSAVSQPNLTPLSVHTLTHDLNSIAVRTQNCQKSHSDTSNNRSI